MGITVGSCFILLTIAILALIISKNKISETSTTERNSHRGSNILILHFCANWSFSISVCIVFLLLIVLLFSGDGDGYGIRIDPIERITDDIPIEQFSGDVNGYGIRLSPIEPITHDIPIQPTITPTPLPRRSILREPSRRSVRFEDGNFYQTNLK